MNTGGRSMLVGLGKFVGVLVAGLAIGAALGLGLSVLSGNDKSDDETIVAAPASSPTATASATASPADDAQVKVLSVKFEPAQSASGKARKRARLSVRAQVKNTGDGPLTLDRPSVDVAAGSTEADPKADEFAAGLLKPIKAGGSATGTLRFETAGAVTQQLAAKKPATLRIAGQKLKLKR